jgi:transposase
MEQVFERVCGLDVHKATTAACVRVPDGKGKRVQYVQTFGTTTADLLALRDWLDAHGVTHVAMESTGVYWKPVYYVLEERVTCLLVNATHVKKVPGRKTDVQDCVWLAQLLEHGLLRGSFVPPAPNRELRDLTRYRKSLIQERAREANRVHKLLEDAGIKLATVARDVLGTSGRAMLEALVQGTSDPAVLAELARGRMRAKLPALPPALAGHFRPHHAFLAIQILAHLDHLEGTVATLSERIAALLAPFADAVQRLDTIPGVNQRTAEVLVAEIGVDMSRFPRDRHLASWTGICPGNHESAGKHKSGKTRKGNIWLRAALIEAALGATRTTNSAVAARYRRVLRHRGHKKAIVAVAHSLSRHRLPCARPPDDVPRARRRLLRPPPYRTPYPPSRATLEQQGYRVTLQRAA